MELIYHNPRPWLYNSFCTDKINSFSFVEFNQKYPTFCQSFNPSAYMAKVRQNVFFLAEANIFDLAWRFAPCSMPGSNLVPDTATLCRGEWSWRKRSDKKFCHLRSKFYIFKIFCRTKVFLKWSDQSGTPSAVSESDSSFRIVSIQQFIGLESYFKINHCVSKLLSVEVFNNISKLLSSITMKWAASN